tara:strand:- start:117 stop:284 length:168 start_codon:yes stop_codon:yes gene_type:complete
MDLETSPFSIQDKNIRDLDNASKEYQTPDNLRKEQNIEIKDVRTVHYRRDLDSLG